MITVSLGGIGRAGKLGRVWHYVMEGLECVELTVGHGMVEILWVRIKGKTNNEDVIVKIFYRSSQDYDTNELFFEEYL